MEQQIAVYIRLSLEDVDLRANQTKDESNSVGNQRLLIQNYLAKYPALSAMPTQEFCDDGYTGTNFERPQFQRMIERVKAGEISCVIVKDLSRFGRNYLEVGDYLEHIFPFLGVRFIAVNDHFDSNDYVGITSGIDIAFRNLIHQKYSEDLSCKVKSAMHTKMAKGRYVTHPPYGYMKSPADKHRIIPDTETAPVVRRIFDAILAGQSATQVAVMLNEQGVLTPMAYKEWRERKDLVGRLPIWNHRTILRIIKDLKYTGAMVNHKCESRYIRDRSQRRIPQSQWIVTEGMHEGIVTRAEFDDAQSMIRNIAKGVRKQRDGAEHMFYCGHCGRKLRKSCNVNDYFACETSVYQPDAQCGDYRWANADLENVLLEAYKKQLLFLRSRLKQVKSNTVKEKTVDFVARLHSAEKELEALAADKLQQYEAYRAGQMTKEGFLESKAKLLERVQCLETKKEDLRQRMELNRQDHAENVAMIAALETTTNTVDASPEMMRMQMYEDIDRVLIFSNEEIEIRWRFADLFRAAVDESLTQAV